ncbi:MAG: hypothetical protein KAH93_00780, partial [Candidatus Aenigmarchaeota archaeon]|nr:hypothetical protein [Candidatus Aenigmarchaeota archaeon]
FQAIFHCITNCIKQLKSLESSKFTDVPRFFLFIKNNFSPHTQQEIYNSKKKDNHAKNKRPRKKTRAKKRSPARRQSKQ